MRWFGKKREAEESRDLNPYSLDQLIADFQYQGNVYPVFRLNNAATGSEDIDSGFAGIVQGAYRSNGVVFACLLARLSVFSDVRFTFREIRNNVPGDISGPVDGRNPASRGLALLRNPWPGGSTGDLLARMISDVDLAGNAFIARRPSQYVRLRLTGSRSWRPRRPTRRASRAECGRL